jgi:hypothetical protein
MSLCFRRAADPHSLQGRVLYILYGMSHSSLKNCSANPSAKRFNAGFQSRMGIVHAVVATSIICSKNWLFESLTDTNTSYLTRSSSTVDRGGRVVSQGIHSLLALLRATHMKKKKRCCGCFTLRMKRLRDTSLFIHVYGASQFLTGKLTGTPKNFSVQSRTSVNKNPL